MNALRASKDMIQRDVKMTFRESSCELWSNRVRKKSAASKTGPLRPGSSEDALHGSPAQARRAGRDGGMAMCSSPRKIRSIYTQGQSALKQTGVFTSILSHSEKMACTMHIQLRKQGSPAMCHLDHSLKHHQPRPSGSEDDPFRNVATPASRHRTCRFSARAKCRKLRPCSTTKMS